MIFWRAPSQPVPSICTARMAAFLAPLMATQATGTPEGIWTIDSRESRPPRSLVFMGTVMTGQGVNAATTPPRCAALPAAAMITLMPRSCAVDAHSCTTAGLRWAEATFTS